MLVEKQFFFPSYNSIIIMINLTNFALKIFIFLNSLGMSINYVMFLAGIPLSKHRLEIIFFICQEGDMYYVIYGQPLDWLIAYIRKHGKLRIFNKFVK